MQYYKHGMGQGLSSQYIDYKGMFQALPVDYRLPWIPPPSAMVFQADINKNMQENSQLFVETKNLSGPAFGNNLGKIPPVESNYYMHNSVYVPDQSAILQNAFKENLQKNHLPNSNLSNTSGKKNRKKRRKRQPKRAVRPVANDATENQLQQLGYQGWNAVPVMDWSRPHGTPQRFKARVFQNSTRCRTYDKRYENARTSQNTIRNEVTKTLSNVLGPRVTSEAAVRRSSSEIGNSNTISNSVKNVIGAISVVSKTAGIMQKANSSNEFDKRDGDIEYLFTVDPSPEQQMVVELDLQSNCIDVIPNSGTSKSIQKSKADDATTKEIILIPDSTVPPQSRKRKLSNHDEKMSKRPNQPKCTICKICYDNVVKKQEKMFLSSCSHTFCRPCISKKESSKVCPACGDKFSSFRRLFCD